MPAPEFSVPIVINCPVTLEQGTNEVSLKLNGETIAKVIIDTGSNKAVLGIPATNAANAFNDSGRIHTGNI